MGGLMQSGNYTPKKYGVEKAPKFATKTGGVKKPDQVEVLKDFLGTLKDGPRKAAKNQKPKTPAKKK